MSTNQYLIDAATRHAIFLQRYAGGQSRIAQRELLRLRREINARIMSGLTSFQAGRLEATLKEIDGILAAGFRKIGAGIKRGAIDLARDEADLSVKIFNKATTIDTGFSAPSDAQLILAVEASKMAAPKGMMGITIDDALNEFGIKKAGQVRQMIADGVALGDTTPQIAKKIGGVMDTLHRRQLDAIARTVTNHISSLSRQMVYDANSDVLDGYRWISTLDSRTTFICASRDQEVYQIGIGPMPPAHWGCRSTTVPQVKPEFDLGAGATGKRPSIGADGAQVVSGNTGYGGWLKKQPREFVDEALGVERSRLFRSGKLTLDKFVDPTGRVYTLEQLRNMNPFVFQDM